VREDRFYIIDADPEPRTFTELKSIVLARKAKETGKLTVAILFPPKNALPRDALAITQVTRWANEEARIDVTFPASR
jgi:hypothetical protein